ncbi:MAG: hypothetical protein IPP28_00925 [Xanthomonadales bacterium]|nr:hypothetical protein [Xanthomonadales bacterium]
MEGIGMTSSLRSFYGLPGIPGDPFFLLEAKAGKYNLPESGSATEHEFSSLMGLVADPRLIDEFQCFLPLIRGMSGWVAFAPDISELGFCYRSEDYPVLGAHGISWLLVLRPGDRFGQPGLKDLFAHELAHLYAGEGHGVAFAIALNAIRSRCGLPPTTDPYDVQEAFGEFDFDIDPVEAAKIAPNWCADIGFALAASDDLASTLFVGIEMVRSRLWLAESEIRSIEDLTRLGRELKDSLAC